MEKITLSNDEITWLSQKYSKLKFNQSNNTITGKLEFDLVHAKGDNVRIKDDYSIEITLHTSDVSCLPTVRETDGKIKRIADRKNIKTEDLHLNSDNGEMCIIIPPKERDRYPNGFELQQYLYHLEEHFYWISYFDRYEKKPWKDQAHSDIGYLELFKENRRKYRQDVKLYFEEKYNIKFNRQQFNYYMRKLLKKNKI